MAHLDEHVIRRAIYRLAGQLLALAIGASIGFVLFAAYLTANS